MVPSVGRIVHYRLSRQDAQEMNLRRAHASRHLREHREAANGAQIHIGSQLLAGDVVPLLVVRVRADEYAGREQTDAGLCRTRICRDGMPGDDYDQLTWIRPSSDYGVNGQAFLDGNDTFWVISAPEANANGCWTWPPR